MANARALSDMLSGAYTYVNNQPIITLISDA